MIQLLYNSSVWCRNVPPGVKQTRREADHSSPSSVEFKNSCTFNIPGFLLNESLYNYTLQRPSPYRAVNTRLGYKNQSVNAV